MAITQAIMLPIMLGALPANGIAGISSPFLATAITNGFVQYVLTGITVRTQDVGTAGAGVGTGFSISLETPQLQQNLLSTFPPNLINGISSRPLINAIATSISSTLKFANIITAHAGVAVGSGSVSLIPNPSVSVPTFVSNFIAATLVGTMSRNLATAIANGIDQALPTATGFVVIAGPPSPTSAVGNGIGKLI